MSAAEQRVSREDLHEEWRRGISKQDTERLIPEVCRRVRAIAHDLEWLGINPWRVQDALKRTIVERKPLSKDGYTVVDLKRNLFIIETNEDIFDLEKLQLIRWHEVAHVICIIGNRGPSHGLFWKAVVRLLGFPEEARDFPDEV